MVWLNVIFCSILFNELLIFLIFPFIFNNIVIPTISLHSFIQNIYTVVSFRRRDIKRKHRRDGKESDLI